MIKEILQLLSPNKAKQNAKNIVCITDDLVDTSAVAEKQLRIKTNKKFSMASSVTAMSPSLRSESVKC